MSDRRVVITGLGAISPLGHTAQQMWEGLVAGRCGIGVISLFDASGLPCRLAGQVPQYRILDYLPKAYRKAAKLMSRDIELAVIAAYQAIRDSGHLTKGIDPEHVTIDPTRSGINVGAGLISCDLVEIAPAIAASITDGRFDIKKWGNSGMQLVPPLWLLKYLPNMLACHVSIIHDLQGPSNSITSAEVSASLAVAEGRQVILRGDADLVVAGGAEAKVNPLGLATGCLLGKIARCSDGNPAGICRPFDRDATGTVLGEAGGLLVLEALDVAEGRGARIWAEVAGTGESCSTDPRHIAIEEDGRALRVAIEKALEDAGIGPDAIDLVIPHGTGVPDDDLAEARGLEVVFGRHLDRIPVWPTKSQLSNTGAAAGALDLIAAIYAMANGLVPGAINFEVPANGCRLRINRRPVVMRIRYALCCCYTYGGQAAAVILKNPGL